MNLRTSKMELALVGLVVCLPLCIHFIAIVRWTNLNSPKGKFSTLGGYLTSQRSPERVAMIVTQDVTDYVAYASMAGSTLVVPSGPPAYVFDTAGRLIYYSPDIGDDTKFHQRWPAVAQKVITLQDLQALAFQTAAAPNAASPHR